MTLTTDSVKDALMKLPSSHSCRHGLIWMQFTWVIWRLMKNETMWNGRQTCCWELTQNSDIALAGVVSQTNTPTMGNNGMRRTLVKAVVWWTVLVLFLYAGIYPFAPWLVKTYNHLLREPHATYDVGYTFSPSIHSARWTSVRGRGWSGFSRTWQSIMRLEYT